MRVFALDLDGRARRLSWGRGVKPLSVLTPFEWRFDCIIIMKNFRHEKRKKKKRQTQREKERKKERKRERKRERG